MYPYNDFCGEIYHHGIKGQKWGIRRYQNEDGTLTEAGMRRYLKSNRFRRETQKNVDEKILHPDEPTDFKLLYQEMDRVNHNNLLDSLEFLKNEYQKGNIKADSKIAIRWADTLNDYMYDLDFRDLGRKTDPDDMYSVSYEKQADKIIERYKNRTVADVLNDSANYDFASFKLKESWLKK